MKSYDGHVHRSSFKAREQAISPHATLEAILLRVHHILAMPAPILNKSARANRPLSCHFYRSFIWNDRRQNDRWSFSQLCHYFAVAIAAIHPCGRSSNIMAASSNHIIVGRRWYPSKQNHVAPTTRQWVVAPLAVGLTG